MTDLRTAAQQALEYLDAPSEKLWPAGTQDRIITALKAALEEPEYPLGKATTDVGVPVYVVKKAEPVQEPVQEPVAWMDREGDLYKMPEIEGWAPPHTMLYAAPHQRKPLTEETMRECAQAMDAEPLAEGWHELIKFARAIERAHGIKP